MIDLLAQGDESHVSFPQTLEGLEGDAAIPSEAVKLVHHNDIEEAGLGVGKHLLEVRSFSEIVGPGTLPLITVGADCVNASPMQV
jgi:hypothetical protein